MRWRRAVQETWGPGGNSADRQKRARKTPAHAVQVRPQAARPALPPGRGPDDPHRLSLVTITLPLPHASDPQCQCTAAGVRSSPRARAHDARLDDCDGPTIATAQSQSAPHAPLFYGGWRGRTCPPRAHPLTRHRARRGDARAGPHRGLNGAHAARVLLGPVPCTTFRRAAPQATARHAPAKKYARRRARPISHCDAVSPAHAATRK